MDAERRREILRKSADVIIRKRILENAKRKSEKPSMKGCVHFDDNVDVVIDLTEQAVAEEVDEWIVGDMKFKETDKNIFNNSWKQGYLTALGNIRIFLGRRFGVGAKE